MATLLLPFLAGHTAPVADLVLTLSGPFTTFTVSSPTSGDTLTYTKPVGVGQSVVIDCGAAQVTAAGGHVPDPSKITYTGPDLLRLFPTAGTPQITYTADGGSIRVDGAPKYT